MSDILDEVNGIVQCRECPWYKSCIMPMRFTTEDIRRQFQQSVKDIDSPNAADTNMEYLMSNMATAAQNSLLEGCPVFIERLRRDPELAQRIKDIMQNWGKEKDDSGPD